MKSYLSKRSLPLFDFRGIREKGSRLVTSGGKAPGAEPLKVCLNKIHSLLDSKEEGSKLRPMECHDILCYIADAVLSGGIRRSALISLFSEDDSEMANCKSAYDSEIEEILAVTPDKSYNIRVSIYSNGNIVDTKEVFLNEEEYDKLVETNKIEWYYL